MSHQISLANYSIYVGDELQQVPHLLEQAKSSNAVLLVDQNTAEHCLPKLQAVLPFQANQILTIPPGEEYKNLATSKAIWDHLQLNQADRKSVLINLGGGVVGDMGGFCASTYMRGIPFIQIPTTLLAQVDASIGGKVAIDYGTIKNLIGSFTDPLAVIVDPQFLETLPPRELRSGFAEVIKHALIRDINLWHVLLAESRYENLDWQTMILRSIEIKKKVVENDPYERGERKILNFGHTIGHAIESVMLPSTHKLLHGEAIAIGMIAEAYLSQKKSSLSKDHLAEISQYLQRVFNKVELPVELEEEMLERMHLDKKNEGGRINFTLLKTIGIAQQNFEVSKDLIRESLKYYRDL